MDNPTNNILLFLTETIFDLYIFIMILRLVLQTIRADYYNPITQLSVKLTEFLVKPLQRILPSYKNISLGILVILLLLEMAKLVAINLIATGLLPNPPALFIGAIVYLIIKLINFYFYIIVIRAILSWLPPSQHSPGYHIIYQISEPLLMRARRLIPPIAGLDLSPIAVLVILQVISILVMNIASMLI